MSRVSAGINSPELWALTSACPYVHYETILDEDLFPVEFHPDMAECLEACDGDREHARRLYFFHILRPKGNALTSP